MMNDSLLLNQRILVIMKISCVLMMPGEIEIFRHVTKLKYIRHSILNFKIPNISSYDEINNTGQNRGYRLHIGYQIYVGYVYDMYTICNNYTHIGYLISVMFMQKFGDIYYRYRAHITHISGSIISGTYLIHVV